jgi:hypothetical protein
MLAWASCPDVHRFSGSAPFDTVYSPEVCLKEVRWDGKELDALVR